MATEAQLKITLAKLVELSVSSEGETAAKLIRDSKFVKLTVDQNGNAEITGKAGILRFKGNPV
jgi:hypothetical protein